MGCSYPISVADQADLAGGSQVQAYSLGVVIWRRGGGGVIMSLCRLWNSVDQGSGLALYCSL